MPTLTRDEFVVQLVSQIGQNADVLYQQYLAAQIDPYAKSSKPLYPMGAEIEKTGTTLEDVQAQADDLAKTTGREQLVLSVGGALIKIGVAAAA